MAAFPPKLAPWRVSLESSPKASGFWTAEVTKDVSGRVLLHSSTAVGWFSACPLADVDIRDAIVGAEILEEAPKGVDANSFNLTLVVIHSCLRPQRTRIYRLRQGVDIADKPQGTKKSMRHKVDSCARQSEGRFRS